MDSSSGQGCMKLKLDKFDENGLSDVLRKLGKNFIVQQCIVCHDSICNLNPNCVDTFRIITYRWKNTVFHMPAIMRSGGGRKGCR